MNDHINDQIDDDQSRVNAALIRKLKEYFAPKPVEFEILTEGDCDADSNTLYRSNADYRK